ncbi:MAG: glycoside hydrolase family 3 C-terminal domain-containing protein [Lachnospiraceae bacterium]|nr:glycoside hydrolase family 3 C-terminal domain-containing protein [Lachnospiraceae bacterium]
MNNAAKKKVISKSVVTALVAALAVALTFTLNAYSDWVDTWLGHGAMTVTETSGLTGEYIEFTAKTNEEARDNAAAATLKTAEEGMILLRNDDNAALPVSADTKITILGYYAWHNNMSGGEDPATTANAISLGKGLEAAFDTNAEVNALYASTNGDFADPASTFASVEKSFEEYDTAVIVIKRNSGEGNDQVRVKNDNGVQRTGLSLDTAEYKLIDYASKHCSKVVIVINSANAMELPWLDPNDIGYTGTMYTDPYSGNSYDFSGIKAAIWAGCCGSQGGTALAEILKGEVNPSGHTPDIYVRDVKNEPTFVNFGNFEYTNGRSLDTYQGASVFFVEYEEGIYIGYRYHETAAAEAAKGNYAGYDYDENVLYPFGYGLSYTTFDMAYEGTPSYDAATDSYTFQVKVTNTGSVAGKGVAQIYVSQPWEKGQVEKSHVQLVGFAKTKILEPNASEVLTITALRDYFTNYDYKDAKAYTLDAGDYKFYLSENSHSWASIADDDSSKVWTHNIASKIVYNEDGAGKRTTDLVVATNAMDDETNYKFKAYNEGSTGDGFIHTMSREDFAASFPTAPTGDDLIVSDARAIRQIEIYDVWAEDQNPIKEMPVVNTDETNYTLVELRGVDFDDPMWEDYINQFTLESMVKMFSNGGWNELADTDNGVPISYDADSPYGFYAGMLKISQYPHNIWYCGAPMVSATFNLEIATELGYAFAEEAWLFKQDDGQPVTGLYGYGTNTHRSGFGGRNYEYYSEDPVLAGKFAATEASSASEKGLICFMKHYALNDQETNRQNNGYCAWCDEQAFREIYNRSFEIYMKEAKMNVNYYGLDENEEVTMLSKVMPAATGIMTCYNRIGATYGGASNVINQILRDEIGFKGTVLTDAGGEPNTYMTTDFALRRGQNLTLTNNGTNGLYDTESPTAVYWLKQSTHYLLYNKANSNAVMGLTPGAVISYGISPREIIQYVIWGLAALIVLLEVISIVLIATGRKTVEEVEEEDDDYDY